MHVIWCSVNRPSVSEWSMSPSGVDRTLRTSSSHMNDLRRRRDENKMFLGLTIRVTPRTARVVRLVQRILKGVLRTINSAGEEIEERDREEEGDGQRPRSHWSL